MVTKRLPADQLVNRPLHADMDDAEWEAFAALVRKAPEKARKRLKVRSERMYARGYNCRAMADARARKRAERLEARRVVAEARNAAEARAEAVDATLAR